MTYSLYWIRNESHNDVFSQGYVGISKNFHTRMIQHKCASKSIEVNHHLYNAVKKYGWDNLKKSVLCFGEKEYIKDLEKRLRPEMKIGWNQDIGGRDFPVLFGENNPQHGKPHSEESKKRMSQAKKNTTPRYKTPAGIFCNTREAAEANGFKCHGSIRRRCNDPENKDYVVLSAVRKRNKEQ